MYMHMYLIWHKESFKIEQTRVIISEKNSKPLQVQTTDSIKTASSLASIFHLKGCKTAEIWIRKANMNWFFFYLTTQLGNFNSNKPSLLTA